MSSNDNTSTLQAAVDSVTGTVQSVIGSVTGSTADKAQGEAKQDKAQAENDASHTAVKVPGATVSSSGVATDHQDRTAGSWNQTVGSAKETVGGLVGSEVSPTLPFRRGATKGLFVCASIADTVVYLEPQADRSSAEPRGPGAGSSRPAVRPRLRRG